ncbi:histone-like nucleoid-structuring protein Lsr2 [Mycolicibacterium fortuitum]|uniref:histone-like nucleoid-structuring protein Lsr2 n=1 Tax=Mycolicibacterium fortuitum TaxID=1766 RepID=UPI003AB0FD20
MGKIVTIEYVDDLDEVSIDAETVDTVDFSFRGQDYTLVLTKKNGAQFNKDMARYIDAAKKAQARDARAARKATRPEPRKSTKQPAARKGAIETLSMPEPRKSTKKRPALRKAVSRKTATTKPAGPERARAIREWAAANGHTVSKRGRMSAAVIDAYNAAH